jgi:RimJ/RimL family protein N-acetyltransferase
VIPEVSTERLLLRAFCEEDLDAWAAIVGDPSTARFIGGVRSREEAWRTIAVYLGHWTLRGFGQWAVVTRASDELVGR